MPTVEKEVTLACGYGGCCPKIQLHTDGSAVIRDDDGPTPQVINLNAEQVQMLRTTLEPVR